MPMSSLSYERIPETEGEGEGEGLNQQRPNFFSKGYRKLIAGFLCIFVAAGVVFSFLMTSRHHRVPPPRSLSLSLYQTSKDHGDRLKLMELADFQSRGFILQSFSFSENFPEENSLSEINSEGIDDFSHGKVTVDSKITFQSVIGFGGAFTEASAYNFFKLPVSIRDKFLEYYFGDNGIGYSVGRIHINSCDFSLGSYSFDEVAGDYELEHFDDEVTHDTHQIIPFILAAMKKSKRPIQLLASPWSPPAWMKVPTPEPNKVNISTPIMKSKMTGSNTPNGLKSDPQTMAAWAHYLSRFITAYEGHGIPIWAITPQNEPEFPAPWEACAYNASFESKFVEGYLGPRFREEHPEIKILAFDHNKDHLLSWAETMLFPNGGQPSQYVDGMAFHWYGGNGDRLLDGTYGYEAVNLTYHLAPNKILMATEGCSCPGVEIDSWVRAERLGHDVIYDLNNYAQGWIDWNLLVDHEGGPNHLGNLCDAPIFAREDFSHLHLQPKFYYMGHLSKFIPPGSKRIKVNAIGNFGFQQIHPEVHSGVELGLYFCEQSAKQMWSWISSDVNSTVGYLRLMMSVLPEGSSEISSTSKSNNDDDRWLCMSLGDENRVYLTAWECPHALGKLNDEQATRHLVVRMFPLKTSEFKHVLLIIESPSLSEHSRGPLCVTASHGLPHHGSLLDLQPCVTHDSSQHWSFDSHTGELKSPNHELCVTAGWPYLSATGFVTPDDQTVLVVMNEAPLDSYLTIQDSTHGTMISAINANSIETVIYK